ncbi:unnamed protein product [Arctogadus glacialis]
MIRCRATSDVPQLSPPLPLHPPNQPPAPLLLLLLLKAEQKKKKRKSNIKHFQTLKFKVLPQEDVVCAVVVVVVSECLCVA